MKLYRYSLNAAAGLAGLAAMSGVAHADTVDYGALEQLFNEPVTTSATGAPQRATEAPVNMTIITQDEIRRSAAIDIPGVLERYANVDVTRSAAGDADVSIRGYNFGYASRLLVLVNGRQVYLDHYGMTNWNLIPVQMSEIRQIEVVSGPNTALFGFNAVAGVVNIITYDPLEDHVSSASLRAGDDEYTSGSASVTHVINDDVSLRLSGGIADGDGWNGDQRVADSLGLSNPGIDQRQMNAQLGFRINPKVRGNIELSAAHDNRLEEVSDGMLAETAFNTTSIKGDLSAETSAGLFEGQVYMNTLDAEMTINSLAGLAGLMPPSLADSDYENRVFVAQGSWLNRLSPNHTLRLALEYRHNWFPVDNQTAQVTADIFALSGMWNWTIRQNLSATTAVRFDRLELDRDGPASAGSAAVGDFNTDMDEPSVNFGLVWRPTDADSLRFSAARGVQSPSMLEYGLSAGGGGTIVTGNPNIEPTIVENVEVGWDHTIAAIDGKLRASVYWQSNENILAPNGNTDGAFHWFADNIGSSEMVGVDVSLEGKVRAIDWRLSYSHRDIDDDLDRTSPHGAPSFLSMCLPNTCSSTDFEATSPSDVAAATLDWTHGPFELGGEARYVSNTQRFYGSVPFYGRTDIDAYTLVNARAAYKATEWLTLSLIGRNLFDDETETTAYSPIPRAFYLTLSSNF